MAWYLVKFIEAAKLCDVETSLFDARFLAITPT